MKLEGAFLTSKLGRRIFFMFGLAVVVPAFLVFALTYNHALALSSKANRDSLRLTNKHFAIAVFERLELAQTTLANGNPSVSSGGGAIYGHIFERVEEVEPSKLSPQTRALVGRTGSLLVVSNNDSSPRVSLFALNKDSTRKKWLIGTLDRHYLWGDPDAAISDGQVCVRAGKLNLTCLGDAPSGPNGDWLRDEWELFLAPEFGAPSWHFSAVRAHPAAFSAYASLIAPIALGMLLLALLLSSIEIRRILVPLEALVTRIKGVAGGNSAAVFIADDEFATLDRAFDEMESRISSQLLTLRTLQEIDELILNRVPLRQVVELVLKQIRNLVGSQSVALSIDGPSRQRSARHFVWLGKMQDGLQTAADPLADDGASLRTPVRTWATTDAIGTGFDGAGIATISFLTVGPTDGPLVRISVGHEKSAAAAEGLASTGPHIAELAERVAVAAAAEAHEHRLVHQARHDLLTDLPNRLAVLEELPEIVGKAEASNQAFATMFIDLDRFKAINDGLGHGLGDTVLVEVSRRIRSAVKKGTLVARLGGDEFLIIVPNAGGIADAFTVDHAIREALKTPVSVAGELLQINFSAGVAMYPKDGVDPESLMQNADLAMYRAKRAGGGKLVCFAPEMNESAVMRVHMENDLREALQAGQLTIHYQPRVDSRDRSIVGAEALVRWEHPIRGRIMPDEFISLAEECGLINEVGQYVIREACSQLAQWKRAGFTLPLLGINVSSHQLGNGALFDTIAAAIEANGLSWSELELEITESVFVKDSADASAQLQRIRDAGAAVAIDDFGTGYSSLAYLASLPTDTIKIDRAFSLLLHEQATQAVVVSIIALGKALGKTVVAEGVETLESVDLLRNWGCHIIQGYVYFRPLTAAQMTTELMDRAKVALWKPAEHTRSF
jgi:diguanylate cyclase (GGDEF)-like protein